MKLLGLLISNLLFLSCIQFLGRFMLPPLFFNISAFCVVPCAGMAMILSADMAKRADCALYL